MSLPNLITILRFMLVPVAVWGIAEGYWPVAFWAFLVAGLSDALDGFIARQFHQRTELGAYLDPLADKALLVSITISLAVVHAIPVWLVIAIVFRDLMIVAAVVLAWVIDHPVTIKPLLVSKLTTASQIALVVCVLAMRTFNVDLLVILQLLMVFTAALTIASAFAYCVTWVRHVNSMDQPVR